MARAILGAVALATLGCAGAAEEAGAPAVDPRLAALPHVPAQPEVPVFPPELRGLTFRVEARFDGGVPNDPRMARVAQACIANFERWMGAAGWSPVRDPQAPADLVIEEHCAVRLTTRSEGDFVEIRRPEAETLAIVVEHAGAEVVAVPRGPSDYVCESRGAPRDRLSDCTARAETWAQAHILETLIASPPLAELARQISAARAAP